MLILDSAKELGRTGTEAWNIIALERVGCPPERKDCIEGKNRGMHRALSRRMAHFAFDRLGGVCADHGQDAGQL